jgi:hypothetical protein
MVNGAGFITFKEVNESDGQVLRECFEASNYFLTKLFINKETERVEIQYKRKG